MTRTRLIITTICILALAAAAPAGQLHVPDDYDTIQAAIDAAYDGDTVIVAPGIYGERVDFDGKPITIRSIDPNNPNIVALTVIEQRRCYGGLSVSGAVVFTDNEDGNSVLAGFTIGFTCGGSIYCEDSSPRISNCVVERGIACYTSSPTITNCTVEGGIYLDASSGEITNCVITNSRWSGIYCLNSSPTIVNCTITGNTASGGGGISCIDSSPTIVNCTIIGNSAAVGGAIACMHSNPVIINSTISGNTSAWGGGIYCWEFSSPIITGCTITGNSADDYGGAIYCKDSDFEISNCTISVNSAGYGGGLYCRSGDLFLINSTFSDNWAELHGGGIYCYFAWPSISFCTIAGNIAECGGAVYCRYSHSTISNCILWANEAAYDPQIDAGNSNVVATYSDIEDGWPGEGNIDADPCFVDAGYWDVNGIWVVGDYHLLEDSPCIDAGDPNYIPEPNETDLDGNPRLIDGDEDGTAAIDMGAYEFWPAVEAQMKLTPQTLNCASNGKFIKAHITLPEEIFPEDVDVKTPAVADPPDIDSEYIKVVGGDASPVKLEIAFGRAAFCETLTEPGEIEITVTGFLNTGQAFYATDTITVKEPPAIRKSIKQAQTRRLRRNNKSIIKF